MANCNWCKRDMSDPKTEDCTGNLVVKYPDKKELPPSTHHFEEPDGRCHDCGIKHGNRHHPGCDVERCPKCEGQLISCGCLDEKEEEEEASEELRISKNDAQGVQVEWHGMLLTLQMNQHHGISGSLAENKDGKVVLLSFHGDSSRKLFPLSFHEETLK